MILMKAVTETGYSFISNDLHSSKDTTSHNAPQLSTLPSCRDTGLNGTNAVSSTCSEDRCDKPHISHRGPAERKLRCSNSPSRIRNSLSSDAIKRMLLRPDSSESLSEKPFNSRDSSASSSSTHLRSPVSELNVPLIRNKRTKSVHDRPTVVPRRPKVSRLLFNNSSIAPSSVLSHKARQVWTALERRFNTSLRLPQSISEGQLRKSCDISRRDKRQSTNGTGRNGSQKTTCSICTCARNSKSCHSRPPKTKFDNTKIIDKGSARRNANSVDQRCIDCCPSDGCPYTIHRLAQSDQVSKHECPTCQHTQEHQLSNNHITAAVDRTHTSHLTSRLCKSNSWMSTPFSNARQLAGDVPSEQTPVAVSASPASLYALYANGYPPEPCEVTLVRTEFGQRFGMRIERIGHNVFLTTVLRGSPADLAGLKVGDELINLNGYPVAHLSIQTIMELIRSTPKCLPIVYRPRLILSTVRKVSLKKIHGRIGIRLEQLTEGLFVDVVIPNSAASQAGIEAGDELIQVNQQCVRGWSHEAACHLLRDLPNGENVRLHICQRRLITAPCAEVQPSNPLQHGFVSATRDTRERMKPGHDCGERVQAGDIRNTPGPTTCAVYNNMTPGGTELHHSTTPQDKPETSPSHYCTIDPLDVNRSAFSPVKRRMVNSISDWTLRFVDRPCAFDIS